ncbi:GMC family oxidoreductase [bacterium]|nr:GMC family oxidoreductase [bacterium]
MIDKFDVVIIGSGAGGAPIARQLVEKGKSVLVLEKGPLLRPSYQVPGERSDFRRDEVYASGTEKILRVPGVANVGESYYSSHAEPDINDEPHVYRGVKKLPDGSEVPADYATIEGYTAQLVGGGTQLYGGVSLRFTPTDLRLKSFNAGRRTPLQDDPNGDALAGVRDWPVTYDELEPYYALAEELVGINGQTKNQVKPFRTGPGGTPGPGPSDYCYQRPLDPNPISAFAHAGMVALGQRLPGNIEPYRPPLAVITEDHAPSGRRLPRAKNGQPDREAAKTSYVNRYGDPLGLKSNTWVSLLSPLEGNPNFTLRPNCVVTHLTSTEGRVSRVHYFDPGGVRRTVEGKLVVVACSAVESVRLLMLSGQEDPAFATRINSSGLLGRYFLTHCFGGARALVPGRYDKSKALDADWATDCCGTDEFLEANGLWAGAAIYNNTSDQALPLSLFRTHGSTDLDTLWKGFMYKPQMRANGFINFLDYEFGRGLSVSFMANQVPQRDNRVELHPTVKDKWGRPVAYVLKTWHPHDVYLMKLMADQCAEILRLGVASSHPTYDIASDYDLNRKYDRNNEYGGSLGSGGVYQAENALARMANHILGGARFGTDPTDSVLDPNCRAWEFDNLYVTDGSFMPTSGGANPTLTIQANALRVAAHLLKRL